MRIRVLTVSDLHLKPRLYDQLAAAVALHRPDLTVCIGDFLDGEATSTKFYNVLTPKAAANRLAALPGEVALILGNHERACWEAFVKAWQATGRPLKVLQGTALQVGPLCVVGFPCAMGGDFSFEGVPPIGNKHFRAWLFPLLMNVGASAQTLWLMHEPPTLELCDRHLLNECWQEAVELYEPIAVVCGHDHRTIESRKVWSATIGTMTTCVNLGQQVRPIAGPLTYCILEFEFASAEPGLPTRTQISRWVAPVEEEPPF